MDEILANIIVGYNFMGCTYLIIKGDIIVVDIQNFNCLDYRDFTVGIDYLDTLLNESNIIWISINKF